LERVAASIFRVEEYAQQETSVDTPLLATCFTLFFFLLILLDLEDGREMFLRKMG
jgi:hypothetical protein